MTTLSINEIGPAAAIVAYMIAGLIFWRATIIAKVTYLALVAILSALLWDVPVIGGIALVVMTVVLLPFLGVMAARKHNRAIREAMQVEPRNAYLAALKDGKDHRSACEAYEEVNRRLELQLVRAVGDR